MLLEVVARAQRRLLWNALAFQSAVAVIVAFGVLALLLLLGTDLLGWRWVIILPAVSLSAGTWIAHLRLPGAYPTAQLVDCRLNLSDALSTALFFARPHPTRRCDGGVRQAQQAQAIRIAAGADIREAVPIRMPRIIYLAALPAIVAAGLFALRYQFYARLDLRAPMTNIVQALLKDVRSELAKLQDAVHRPDPPDPPEGEQPGTPAADADGPSDNERANPSDTRASASTTPAKGTADRQQTEMADTTMAEDKGESEPGQQSPGDAREDSLSDPSSNRQADGRRQQQQGTGNQGASSSGASTSMVSSIKNSIANLLSALSPKPGGSGQQQQQMSKAQGGRSTGSSQKEGAQGSNSANGEPGEGSQQPGNGKSAGGIQTAGTPSEKQPGSGAGRDDGAKDIQAAGQLDAMGKLSVLLGKRSENITGEFTAEAAPGPQRLTTAYERRGAQHTAVQATAQRDDVSLASQEYVQRYFELVRKAGASSRRPERTAAASGRRSHAAR